MLVKCKLEYERGRRRRRGKCNRIGLERPSTGDDEAKGGENAGRALTQEGEGLKRKAYVLLPLVAVQRNE
jgi:hypothetical protein